MSPMDELWMVGVLDKALGLPKSKTLDHLKAVAKDIRNRHPKSSSPDDRDAQTVADKLYPGE